MKKYIEETIITSINSNDSQ